MIRQTIVGLIALLASSTAESGFFTYEQWSALSEGYRAAYVAGAFDSFVTFVNNEQMKRSSEHYTNCLRAAHMTDAQLATNVLNFAKDKPEFHTGTVQHALIQYLIAACGKPSAQ